MTLHMVKQIEGRVRPTICPTWSEGRHTIQGRITLSDFEILLRFAERGAVKDECPINVIREDQQ